MIDDFLGNKIKITACVLVSSPSPFISQVLKSLYEEVDEFVIVYSSPFIFNHVEYKRHNIKVEEMKVFNILMDFINNSSKPVKFIKSFEIDTIYNRGISVDGVSKDTTHIFIVDADEFWDFRFMQGSLKNILKVNKDVQGFYPEFVYTPQIRFDLNNPYISLIGTKFYRLFKYDSRLKFGRDKNWDEIISLKGKNLFSNINDFCIKGLRVYHFSALMPRYYVYSKLRDRLIKRRFGDSMEVIEKEITTNNYFTAKETDLVEADFSIHPLIKKMDGYNF